MPAQIRSADLMVTNILADAQTKQDLSTALADPDPKQAATKLTELAKKATAQTAQLQPPLPGTTTNNYIWFVVVTGFVLIMVGSAAVLGQGMYTRLDANIAYAVKSDTILTLFTSCVAFLAGLLSPSPINKTS